MLSKSLKLLLGRAPTSSSRILAAVLGCVVALAAPLLALVFAHIAQALGEKPHEAVVGGLPVMGWNLSEAAPMARVSWLLTLAALICATAAILLLWMYRLVQQAAVEFEVATMDIIRHQIQPLARQRTLTAQQSVLLDCLEYHLPRVRGVIAKYWQALPRHAVQLVACLAIASLIHFRFAVLACIAAALVALFFQLFERSRKKQLPVVRENATRLRNRLVRASLRGPLLHAVHDSQEIDRRFHHFLELYQRDAVRSLISSSWRMPLIVIGLSVLGFLMMFVMSVQWFRNDLELPAVTAFLICLSGAGFSARRLWQVYRELKLVKPAADELDRFLSIDVQEPDSANLRELSNTVDLIQLEHVTVQDSLGRKLLTDISLDLQPGKLLGIVATQGLESRTLAELLIGLGRPTSGRMLVGGHVVSDLKPDALTRCSHWVASDGGILTGSLSENLSPATAQKMELVIQQAELSDLSNRLTEGFHTVITHDDDRLMADEAFRIGLARALLRDATICLIEEPETAVGLEAEQQTMGVIKQLIHASRFTVALPQRLATLRACDRVFFIHEHQLVDAGTHAELVQRNDLYRHLTYLRFNPFGH